MSPKYCVDNVCKYCVYDACKYCVYDVWKYCVDDVVVLYFSLCLFVSSCLGCVKNDLMFGLILENDLFYHVSHFQVCHFASSCLLLP